MTLAFVCSYAQHKYAVLADNGPEAQEIFTKFLPLRDQLALNPDAVEVKYLITIERVQGIVQAAAQLNCSKMYVCSRGNDEATVRGATNPMDARQIFARYLGHLHYKKIDPEEVTAEYVIVIEMKEGIVQISR